MLSTARHIRCCTEPDAKQDKVVKLSKRPVTVPLGKVKPNPLASGGAVGSLLSSVGLGSAGSSFAQSEYLVYRESQVRIRYVVRMDFETQGGHWH